MSTYNVQATKAKVNTIKPMPLIKAINPRTDRFTAKIPINPNDTTRTQSISVAHFNTGTTEEFIAAYIEFQRLCHFSPGTNKLTLAQLWLKGDSLSKLERICRESDIPLDSTEVNETTNGDFKKVMKKLTEQILPRNAYLYQTAYMEHELRKPLEMTTRQFVERVYLMNDYLVYYPPDFNKKQKFSEKKLHIMIERGLPAAWRTKLLTDGKDAFSENTSIVTLIDWGERQELADAEKPKYAPVASMPNKMVPHKKSNNGAKYTSTMSGPSKQKYCHYHKTNTHDHSECHAAKRLAAKAGDFREKQTSTSTPQPKNDLVKKQYLMFQKWLEEQDSKPKAKPSKSYMLMDGNIHDNNDESQGMDETETESGEVDKNDDVNIEDLSIDDLDELLDNDDDDDE